MGAGFNAGVGLTSFADNFLKSFMQAKLLKHQDKLQQNAQAYDLLKAQLGDENIPYFKRAQILDEMGRLIGVKEPLSQRIGMDKWNEQEVAQNPGTPNTTLTDPNVPANNDLSINPNITMQGTQPSDYTQQGNLTPAKLKLQYKMESDKAESALKVAEQEKIIAFQINKQQEYLDKAGWEKQGDIFFNDQTKTWNQTWFNPKTNEQRTQEYPQGYDPLTLITAKIKANKPTGKLGQLQLAHEIISTYDANPNLIPKFQYDAAKDLLDDFNRNGRLDEAKINSLNMAISGAKPITPQQDVTNTRASSKDLVEIQKDIDNSQADEDALLKKRNDIGVRKEIAAREAERADQAFANISNKYSADDNQYKDAKRTAIEKRKVFNNLESAYNNANTDYTAASNRKSNALTRKQEYLNNTQNTRGGGGDNTIPSEYKPAINVFRKNNSNNPKYANWTDTQILEYLGSKGIIKWPK